MKSINLLKRLASVVAGFLLGVSALSAQNITVTGTVTDALKEPIIGASVLQQGTTKPHLCQSLLDTHKQVWVNLC
jgi:hypothetical protein